MNAFKSLFSTYLSHLVGYIVSAAGIVSVVDPTLLPPVGKLGVAIAGLVTVAAHHGYTAGAGTQVAQAAVDAATKALTAVAKSPAALMLMMALTVGMTGCAQVSSFLGSPTGATVVQASVDVAVATAEAKGISAAQINAIAHKALDADSNVNASLAAVSAVVQAEIVTLKLPAADQAAADILLAALSAAIQTKVGTNASLAQAQTAAAVVINDVIAATGG